jgi:hypothetical protein
MSEYYCHKCAAEQGLMNPLFPADLVSNQYQLEKFIKHTAPVPSESLNSIFHDPSLTSYSNYVISTSGSGCLMIDNKGRKNVIWAAGKETGVTFEKGRIVWPNDGVKVVFHNNEWKIHGFPFQAQPLFAKRCKRCGCPIVY